MMNYTPNHTHARIERRQHKSREQLGLALGLLLVGFVGLTHLNRDAKPAARQNLLELAEAPAPAPVETNPSSPVQAALTLPALEAPALDISKPIQITEIKAAPESQTERAELIADVADSIDEQIEAATTQTITAESSTIAAPTWHLTEETFATTIRLNRNPKTQLSFPDADLERRFTVMPSEGQLLLDHDTKLAFTYSIGAGTKTASASGLKPFEFRGKAFVNQFQVGVIQFFLN